ncbi:MAG: peptide-methionine (R)-S-oxide reductase MsrB [Janthinobacterium lividum]
MTDRENGLLSGLKGFFAPEPDGHAATPEALAIDENGPATAGKTDADWRAELSPDQFRVLREHGTERPGTSPLNNEKRAGVFDCAACGTPVYTSETKYDSRSGWPSFFAPIPGAVETTVDRSLAMVRTEVHCATCGGHLGHVFDDGPRPTGQRHCINGVALTFEPAAK